MASPDQESFEALLDWLDADLEVAARQYEIIRAGLIRIFVSKGFTDPEHSADEVIDIVIIRLPEVRNGYVGEKARYFHGVARYKILEWNRRKEVLTDDFRDIWLPDEDDDNTSDDLDCLKQCLEFLTGEKRELILDYHVYQGPEKIKQHRQMAHELAITENALRGRTHHIRANLEKCVQKCIEDLRATQNAPEGS